MKTLYLKAAAWLALPVLVLMLAVLTGFQNPGRFSGAVGRQEFNDSLATRRDSIRSITARIDTIVAPNGQVYVNDSLWVQENLTVQDTIKVRMDSLKLYSRANASAVGASGALFLIAGQSAQLVLDSDNNQTNEAFSITQNGESALMLAIREISTGDSLRFYGEYAKMDGSLTVTDTLFGKTDSLMLLHQATLTSLASRGLAAVALDYDNNQTNGTFYILSNTVTSLSSPLFQVTETNGGNGTVGGNLTVTDTTTATGGLKVGAGTLITGIVDKTDSLLIILNVTDSCYVKITTRL